jgi:hypothetical protein
LKVFALQFCVGIDRRSQKLGLPNESPEFWTRPKFM